MKRTVKTIVMVMVFVLGMTLFSGCSTQDESEQMAVTTTVSDDSKVVTLRIGGRFDFTMHQEFLRAYKQHPPGETHFVVDLSEAEYLDSSGRGLLLKLPDHAASFD